LLAVGTKVGVAAESGQIWFEDKNTGRHRQHKRRGRVFSTIHCLVISTESVV